MKTAFGALALISLTACSTVVNNSNLALSKAIVNDSMRLNDAFNQATNGIILKNILRAKDHWTVNFTTLSGIQSNPELSNQNALSLNTIGLGNTNDPGPLQASTNGITSRAVSRNTYSINPFATQNRSESLLLDVPETLFEGYWNGWPKDVVLLLFVESLTLEGHKPCRNDGDNYERFQQCLKDKFPEDIRKTRYADGIDFRNDLGFTLPVKTQNANSAKACAQADISVSDIISKEHSFIENLEKIESVTGGVVSITQPERAGKIALQICQAEKNTGKVFVIENKEFSVNYRSLLDIIHYLGESLRVPPDKSPKVKNSCTTKFDDENADNESIKVPLFKTYKISEVRNPINLTQTNTHAITVRHANEIHQALPRLGDNRCAGERSATVMAILNQLLLLNQSEEFLKAPNNTIIR